jgi:hypothetical protein
MDIKDLKIGFQFSIGETELILAGLRKLPMELVQDLYAQIISNANAEVAKQLPKEQNVEQTTEN